MIPEILSLIFPHTCFACGKPQKKQMFICLSCKRKLPRTSYAEQDDNPIINLFWGKANVQAATAIYYFRQGNRVQKLIHELKYKGKTQLGTELGRIIGQEIKEAEKFAQLDGVIPVPLHRKKKAQRGYNQCDFLANGIAEQLNIPLMNKSVLRIRANKSQTRKGFFQRHKNVEHLFAVRKPAELTGKRLLLVDDVVTTGSTLSSLVNAIHASINCELLIVTFAVSA